MSTATIVAPSPADMLAAPRHWVRLLCVLFFFSGFPALIYQLVWQRALFRIFGVNIESVTIVVTAFMLGLGLGSLAGGWLSKRERLPLLLVMAAIEALTGLFGLCSLAIFERAGHLVLGASLPVTGLVTLSLVVVPTLLMGATLPLLVGHMARRSGSVGRAVGLLYYANTLGAGAACLVCAVALFPLLGMHRSVHVAVAFNAAVALGALVAHLGGRHRTVARRQDEGAPYGRAPLTRLPFGSVLAMSAIGGLISLSYEIFFFRTMSYATGNSPVAFATTLGAFLVGLAAGAREGGQACANAVGDTLLRSVQRSLAGASIVGCLFLPLLSHLAWLDRGILGVGLLAVYLMARFWGALLPYLAQLGMPADALAGTRMGLFYFSNIVGATFGTVVTGFVLMEHLTLTGVGQLLVGAGVVCMLVLDAATAGWAALRRPRSAAVALIGTAALLLQPSMSSDLLEVLMWKAAPEAKTRFASVIENRSGIVTVDPTGTVYGNGVYDGHFNVELTNDVNGIVRPYALSLFHPAPRDVLMIGLSTGSWAQVIVNNPAVTSLTVVEINPGYRDLVARTPMVASLLANPKVHLVTDDGRRWLRMHADRRFDAIVSNTTFHFRANASNLLSVDFLAMLKAHLNPGGIVFYNTTDSARVQRTGCMVFEHGARFTNHMVLSSSPIDWDFARWRRSLETYRIDGRPMIDLSNPVHVMGIERLMALESQVHPGATPSAADWIEPCEHVLSRTAGRELVTDDNMGTEWRHFWDRE
jgi:spermidine synthase